MNLYQIDGQIQNLLFNGINQDTGEVINETLLEELEALKLNKEEKQKNAILFHKNLQNEEAIIDSEIRRLQALRSICQKKQDGLRKLIEVSLGDTKKIDFVTCGASIKKNPPSVIIDDDADLKDYSKVEMVVKVDKAAIKKAIQEGKEVKGARLEQKTRLEIY